MAKVKVIKKDKEYKVLVGCNTSTKRYEAGDKLKESEVKPSDLKALLEMGAIDGDN